MLNSLKCFLYILSCTTGKVCAQKLLLFEAGKSNYDIIISVNADEHEVYAAKEFQRYFKAITKVELAIKPSENLTNKRLSILIGKGKRFTYLPTFQLSSIYIKTEERNLIISGGEGKGVLYAVYSFFEQYLNCRFYALDEILTPKKNRVEIAEISYSYSPPFNFRSYYSLENADRAYADFLKENYFFENRLYPAHSLAWLLPASKYFENHSEFFALINGKRDPSQICFSSLGALNELIKVLKLEVLLTPNKVWSVSHLDSPNSCHCNLCEAAYIRGSGFTETLMPFVNKVARAFPEKTISTLAYNQSILPSKLVKPEKNVEIMFCFTNVDRRYGISDAKNLSAKKYIDALGLWKAQTNDLFIWDYSVNYLHSLSPFPNIQTFQPNLLYFSELGIKKVFLQGIGPQIGEFSELKSYLGSKFLWDPRANSANIIDEFLQNYYGDASTDIKNYLSILEVQSKRYDNPLNEYASPATYKDGYLNPSNIHSYKSILQLALSKVKTQKKYYDRVKKELLAVEYADLEINSGTPNDRVLFNRKLSSFEVDAKALKIKNLRNGELTVDEFVNKKGKQ